MNHHQHHQRHQRHQYHQHHPFAYSHTFLRRLRARALLAGAALWLLRCDLLARLAKKYALSCLRTLWWRFAARLGSIWGRPDAPGVDFGGPRLDFRCRRGRFSSRLSIICSIASPIDFSIDFRLIFRRSVACRCVCAVAAPHVRHR